MITHPDSLTAFAFMRHEEQLAACVQEQQAIAAASRPVRPGAPRGPRTWLSNALVRLRTSLHGEARAPLAPGTEAERLPPAAMARLP